MSNTCNRKKSFTLVTLCLIFLFYSTSLISGDEWLNHFIEYSDDGKILKKFPKFHEGSFEIPQGVEEIGNNAFYECRDLTEIIIPDSVIRIGEKAFSGCTSLESVTIPDSVKVIEYSTFYKCESLTAIEIPESVTEIKHYAFDKSGLVSIVVKGHDVKIGGQFVNDCSNLEYVDLRYASEIGDGAFRACSSLKEVIIPKGIDYHKLFTWSRPIVYLFFGGKMERAVLSYDSLAWVNSAAGLMVSMEPGLEDTGMGTLEDRTAVVVLSEEKEIVNLQGKSGKWTRIHYKSGEGWVFGGFLSDEPYWRTGRSNLLEKTLPLTAVRKSSNIISTQQITGEWYVTYKNGSPVAPRGTGESSLNNFTPYTGPSASFFSFEENNRFLHGIASSDIGNSGYYSLQGNKITCLIQSGYEDEIVEDSYQIEIIDNTHIQITDLSTDDWYLCALYDNSLLGHLRDSPLSAIIEYIDEKKYLGSTFPSNESLLMLAVQSGNVELVEWLIHSADVDVNQTNIYGMTALHYAMGNADHQNSVEIIELLIESGTAVNALDSFCQTALDYSLYDWPRNSNNFTSRFTLANAGGRSSRERWAIHMTRQDFK